MFCKSKIVCEIEHGSQSIKVNIMFKGSILNPLYWFNKGKIEK